MFSRQKNSYVKVVYFGGGGTSYFPSTFQTKLLCVIVLTFRTKQVYNLALGRARAGLGLECVNREKKKCTSGFIWGQMRSRAWETASQIALWTCSKEQGEVSIYIWQRGYVQSSTHLSIRLLLVTKSRLMTVINVTINDFVLFQI